MHGWNLHPWPAGTSTLPCLPRGTEQYRYLHPRPAGTSTLGTGQGNVRASELLVTLLLKMDVLAVPPPEVPPGVPVPFGKTPI
jgi:hypothetical protein